MPDVDLEALKRVDREYDAVSAYQDRSAWGRMEMEFMRQRKEIIAALERGRRIEVAAREYGVEPLKRLASVDEMAGAGVLEEMTGPAAEEVAARRRYAGFYADKLRAALAPAPAEEDRP